MKIKCIRAFGNFIPGDVLEVPDGCTFDTYYFELFTEPAPAQDKAPKTSDGGDK